MELLDRFSAWLMLGIGILHSGVTFLLFQGRSENAFWFFASGLAMIYAAALNVLRIRYSAVAPGLGSVCVAVNFSLLAFILAYAAFKGLRIFRNPGAVVLLTCLAASTLFSAVRRPHAETRSG